MSSIKCIVPGCANVVSKGLYCSVHFPDPGTINKYSTDVEFSAPSHGEPAFELEAPPALYSARPHRSRAVLILLIALLAILGGVAALVIFMKFF